MNRTTASRRRLEIIEINYTKNTVSLSSLHETTLLSAFWDYLSQRSIWVGPVAFLGNTRKIYFSFSKIKDKK